MDTKRANISTNKKGSISPSDVAKYFLYRSNIDGDLITPLKMQKLVYYAYVWNLVLNKQKLFEEGIEAWPSGPVVPSLYQELKHFGSMPIDGKFFGHMNEKQLEESVFSKFDSGVKQALDKVYEKYMTQTAFELVTLTHAEKPWLATRGGLSPTEKSNNVINDKIILEYYGKQKKN